MKHAVIERTYLRPLDRVEPRPARRQRRRRPARLLPSFGHSAAATRFAEVCAAIGGTTMLQDLMPDLVTVSFGSKTKEVWKRLRARGWYFVGTATWRGEPVLGVSFAGDRRATITAEELADALIGIVREMEVAETRVW